MAKIGNGAGEFAALTGEAAGKTIAGAKITGPGDDLKLTIDYTTKEAGAYPIVLVTYEIVCSKGSAADKCGRSRVSWATPPAPRARPR